uniref:Zinc-ribbon containing domain protein n=1 Tax=Myoviridae sp. ctijX18 TaxID=2825154 RepID=A0A8S5USR2_9CAUD|nr:MAG TPA: zinc-ribbon containing domain protein [Myoviridae sp. ctijX18]DAJ69072.1 MAG TPA: zinc-ribbon containing domain protein [Caudoviricetes sp.]
MTRVKKEKRTLRCSNCLNQYQSVASTPRCPKCHSRKHLEVNKQLEMDMTKLGAKTKEEAEEAAEKYQKRVKAAVEKQQSTSAKPLVKSTKETVKKAKKVAKEKPQASETKEPVALLSSTQSTSITPEVEETLRKLETEIATINSKLGTIRKQWVPKSNIVTLDFLVSGLFLAVLYLLFFK